MQRPPKLYAHLESLLILGFCSKMSAWSFCFSLSSVALSLQMMKFPTSSHKEQICLKFVLVKKLVPSQCQGTCHNRFTVCTINKEAKGPKGGESRGCPGGPRTEAATESVDTEAVIVPTTSVRYTDIWKQISGFPAGSEGKESVSNEKDPGSILGLGRPPGGDNGYPLQCSCLENPMDKEPVRL